MCISERTVTVNFFDAIIQGLIQGLTEFLPVSSSGHLSLYQHFTGLSGEAGGMYAVLLHMGTLLSVVIAFWKELLDLLYEFIDVLKDLFRGKLRKESFETGPRHMLWLYVVAELPLLGFYFLSDFYNSLAADSDIIVEGACFLLTAALIIYSGICAKKVKGRSGDRMTWKDALAIGIVQGIAPLPGLSRSGSTISTGLICGVSREQAVSFSFIMGLPVVLAANLLELKDIIGGEASVEWIPALVGMAVALVSGVLAIKTVKLLVKNDKFNYFAYYLLVLGAVTVGCGIYEHLTGNLITF